MQTEPRSWREALSVILRDGQEKRRLTKELGIDARTLERWAAGSSNPRVPNLLQLIDALPTYRPLMTRLIEEEFPEISNRVERGEIVLEDTDPKISVFLYEQVLRDRAKDLSDLTQWGLCLLLLRQCVAQLDSADGGIAALVIKCVPPPPGEKVHALREYYLEFSRAWPLDRREARYYLGSESIAGSVVSSYQPIILRDLGQEQMHALPLPSDIRGLAIYPIIFQQRIAGCLQVMSAQSQYFSNVRVDLVTQYANLLSLAFPESQFYTQNDIDLRLMSEPSLQLRLFSHFNERVNAELSRAEAAGLSITRKEAENRVYDLLFEKE